MLPAPSGIKRKNSSPNCEGPIKISKEKEKKGVGAPRKDQEGRRDIAETDRERLMALLERPLICHSKGATEMERQFWVAYNDTRARLNRPHHDPFCRCDPCRGWEIIEFLIAGILRKLLFTAIYFKRRLLNLRTEPLPWSRQRYNPITRHSKRLQGVSYQCFQ